MKQFSTKGTHFFIDLWEPKDNNMLNELEYMKYTLESAIHISGAHIVSCQSKAFDPMGLTILFLLEESHASIHTYPESGYAALDLFTCGDINPESSIGYLIDAMQPAHYTMQRVERGIRYH